MKTRLFIMIGVAAALGCDLLKPEEVQPPTGGVPEVSVDVLWSGGQYAPSNVFVKDGAVYVIRRSIQVLAKLDLVTGAELWATTIGFYSEIIPQWINGKLWLVETPDSSGTWAWCRLAEFDAATGERTCLVRIESAVHMPRADGVLAHGTKLYWGMTRDRDNNDVVFPYGFISVDTDPVSGDFTTEPDYDGDSVDDWRAVPKMVYTLDSSRGPLDLSEVFGTSIVVNGLLVFHDAPFRSTGTFVTPAFVTGLDVNTWEVKWRLEHNYYMAHNVEYPFSPIDATHFILNAQNVWQFDVTDPDNPVVTRYDNASSTIQGNTVEGDSLYVSGYTSDYADGARVYRVRLSDGVRLWISPEDPVQLGTNPQVKDGVVYVPAYDALRLYDAETGALLGQDPKAAGQYVQFMRSEREGEYLVINYGSGLRVVRMNWRVEGGKLVKG